MGIKPDFNMNGIKDTLAKFRQDVDTITLMTLQYLGEELSNYAKENISFTPQTGNLQNSIGYVVVKQGKVIQSGAFGGASMYVGSKPTSKDDIKVDGAKEGLEFALKVAKTAPAAYTLIIVAGMNYAAYVEAKGYNVILPAELKAKIDIPKELKKLSEQARAKAKSLSL